MIHMQLKDNKEVLTPKQWAYLHDMSNKSNHFWETDQRCRIFAQRLGVAPVELKRQLVRGRRESNNFESGLSTPHWSKV